MSGETLFLWEMILTLGLCLGFGFQQLWSLRRANARAAQEEAARRQEKP